MAASSNQSNTSPADPASPPGEGANGFTPVNGRNSPGQNSAKAVRTADEGRPKSAHHQDEPRRVGGNANAHGERAQRPNGLDLQINASPLSTSVKRKRSLSVHIEEDVSSDESDQDDDEDDEDERSHTRANYPTPVSGEPWHGRQGDDQTEARLTEALQRDRQQSANGHGGPTDHAFGHAYVPDKNTGLLTTNAGVQVDPKKRKRAFTNRTKTGCQTCRRRKKKCDEAKPECHNCQRGGFVCEGYAAKSQWPKPNTARQPPMAIQPIQAREPYESGNLYPRPLRGETYLDSPSQPHSGIRGRPITIDDEAERPIANQWNDHPTYLGQRPYQREPTHALPLQSHSLRMGDYDRSMPTSSMHSGVLLQSSSLHSNASPVTMAQHALQQPPANRQQTQLYSMTTNKSEKEKMRVGELYNHYDTDLVERRERCKDSLMRFNNNRGTSREEGARLLRKVFELEDSVNSQVHGHPTIRIGKGVYVDPPFHCDYGFNIVIGADVGIEGGCFISDPCEVVIGANTMIGPGVRIMGKQLPQKYSERAGTLYGKARGYRIFIGEGVYIGHDCSISPSEEFCTNGELRIGNGSYIANGTMVIKNVPEYVLFGVVPGGQADVIKPLQMHVEEKNKYQSRASLH